MKLAERDVELGLEVRDPSQLNLRVSAQLPYGFHQVCERRRRYPCVASLPSLSWFSSFAALAALAARTALSTLVSLGDRDFLDHGSAPD